MNMTVNVPALLSCVASRPAPLTSDALLIELGRLQTIAGRAEAAAWLLVEAAEEAGDEEREPVLRQEAAGLMRQHFDLCRRIRDTPARTAAGLLVKCRAIAWIYGGSIPDDAIRGDEAEALDVVRNLMALLGGQKTGGLVHG